MLIAACASTMPPRSDWPAVLRGAHFEPLTPELHVAKRPIYLGAGGRTVHQAEAQDYMRRLEARLERSIRKPGTQITRIGTTVTVLVVRSSLIEFDRPEFSSMGKDILNQVVRALNEFDRTWVEITGFTDAMASQDHAIALSQDMAQRTAVFLAHNGISPIRMFITGRGASNPIADNSTDVGRLMNQRVEIRISPVFPAPPSTTFDMVQRGPALEVGSGSVVGMPVQ